jgi:hypothetical protein
MPPRACLVTIRDLDGVAHTAHVTASSLYEAVARGLQVVRGKDWVAELPEGLAKVKIEVTEPRVEHTVVMNDFMKWLEKKSGSPKDCATRYNVKEILGMNPLD